MTIQLKPEDLPATMQCTRGETWPITSFGTQVVLEEEEPPEGDATSISVEMILITCPSGHEYPLSRALKKKLLSRKIADKMLEMAREAAPKLRELERNPPPYKANDFPLDPEISAKRWPCVRCGAKAECKTSWRGEKETVLCRECRAAFANYGRGQSVFPLFDKARGFSQILYWLTAFYRFALDLPPLSPEEHSVVLARCREEAKRRKTVDVAFIKSLAQNPSLE